jgi:hypothetical protein
LRGEIAASQRGQKSLNVEAEESTTFGSRYQPTGKETADLENLVNAVVMC